MKIIVGLGNPGPQYETTRHNVGFLALDSIAEKWGAGPEKKQLQSLVQDASVEGTRVLLVKPQTYMNLSGESVGPLLRFFKLGLSDLLVIHDELDLNPLELRLKIGGGTGGHNGLKSIDAALGGKGDYTRLRIGVGHPHRTEPPRKMSPADYVLEPFSDQELRELDPVLVRVEQAARMFVAENTLLAMNQFNVRATARKEIKE